MSGEEQGKPQGERSWKLNRRPPYSLEVKRIGDRCERHCTDESRNRDVRRYSTSYSTTNMMNQHVPHHGKQIFESWLT
ncbi:unnamed protein product [Lasius platythorax]|uniref:Uncharacterized protein n=1 Tax=Lasius platythorax TaxID=488582 RepID=A0AAV2NNF2_9HYME